MSGNNKYYPAATGLLDVPFISTGNVERAQGSLAAALQQLQQQKKALAQRDELISKLQGELKALHAEYRVLSDAHNKMAAEHRALLAAQERFVREFSKR